MTDELKPEVSVQPIKSEPVDAIPGWAKIEELEQALRLKLREEYQQLFQYWKLNELKELEAQQGQIIREGIQKLFDNWKESQKPPTDQDLQLLLSQEYKTFNIEVEYSDASNAFVKKAFVIRELPASVERKFYNQFKSKLESKANIIQAFAQGSIDMPFEEKIRQTLELFDDSFDMLADAVVMILNPFGKDTEVTRAWVQDNINLDRMWRIVEAQIGVNRLKDFFSKISQSGQSMTTMLNGVNYQQLQQLAR